MFENVVEVLALVIVVAILGVVAGFALGRSRGQRDARGATLRLDAVLDRILHQRDQQHRRECDVAQRGIDVHRMKHVVTTLIEDDAGHIGKQTREFGGFKRDLKALLSRM